MDIYCKDCVKELKDRMGDMEELERAVAQHITLPWIKRNMKALDEDVMDAMFLKVLKELGNVTWDDVALEAHRQENWFY